jgi:hypothetical protein
MKYAALTIILLLVLGGCKEDDRGCTLCPGDSSFTFAKNPTISNIWPNEDLTSWTFSYSIGQGASPEFTYYQDPNDIPAFTWDDAERLIDSSDVLEALSPISGVYKMQFDSLKATQSGAVGQNLKEELDLGQGSERVALQLSASLSFYARLYAARPDLRDKIAKIIEPMVASGEIASLRIPTASAAAGNPPFDGALGSFMAIAGQGPMLIHGGAWKKTLSWIGTYGDLDQLPAWKFLSSDLRAGAEFTHQLVPALADDVFLRCRIQSRVNERTAIGTFRKSLDCWYIVDYGVLEVTDMNNNTFGYARVYDCGRVIYSPTVGPVYSFEADFIDAGKPTSAFAYKELSIVATSLVQK